MVGIWSAETFFLHLPMLGDRSGRVGSLFPPCINIMAISNSIALGRASGSLGNVTLRSSRGRTIASRKRGGRPATRAGIPEREFIFGLINRFAAARRLDIDVSFQATKYGSPRNAFVKYNYSALYAALVTLYQPNTDVFAVSDAQISEAVAAYATANPESIYRVKMGGVIEYLAGEWPMNAIPTPSLMQPMSIGGKTVTMNASLNTNDVKQGAVVSVAVGNAELLTTTISEASLRYLEDDGSEVDVNVPLTDVSLSKSGEKTILSGKLSAAIPKTDNVYELRLSVVSTQIKNAIIVTGVKVVAAPNNDGNNPL